MENIAKLIEFEQKLLKYDGDDRIEPGDVLLSEAQKSRHDIISAKSKIAKLDKDLGDFDEGELTVISGPTGSGKTTLAQTFTLSFVEQGLKPLWFSFEMPWRQFLSRFHPDYLTQFYGPAKLSHKSLEWIETRIWEAKIKYQCSVVFVDHLHFLLDLGKVKNASMEIGEIVRRIKRLALKHRLIFFLIAHTVKVRGDQEFGLGDVRDSGMIEAEADNVLYIWRDKGKENRSILKVAKNRKHGIIEKKIPLILAREHDVIRYREETKEY